MAKKGGFWDNPFGGLFDFNGDGKEDWSEQWIAHQFFEECTRKEKTQPDPTLDDLDLSFLDDTAAASAEPFRRVPRGNGSGSDMDLDAALAKFLEEVLPETKENAVWQDTGAAGTDVFFRPKALAIEEDDDEDEESVFRDFSDDDDGEFGLDPDDFASEDVY